MYDFYFGDENYFNFKLTDYFLDNDCFTSICDNCNINYQGFTKDYEINNNEENFRIQELEIFQILFD